MQLWACIFVFNNITSSTYTPSRTAQNPRGKKEQGKRKWNGISQDKLRTQRGYRRKPAAALCPGSPTHLRLCSKVVKGESRRRRPGFHGPKPLPDESWAILPPTPIELFESRLDIPSIHHIVDSRIKPRFQG